MTFEALGSVQVCQVLLICRFVDNVFVPHREHEHCQLGIDGVLHPISVLLSRDNRFLWLVQRFCIKVTGLNQYVDSMLLFLPHCVVQC